MRTTMRKGAGDVQPAVRMRRPPWAVPWPSRPLLVFVGLLACLLWSDWPTVCTLARRWSEDPQYSHGWVVPAFALIVLWSRRSLCPTVTAPAGGWGLAGVALAGTVRLAGAWFYLPWLEQAALLPALAGLCLLAGGRAALRWAWPALAFLVFMLPLPFRLEVALALPLRRLATHASTYALQTLGVPALSEGTIIVLGHERIGVAEACSGLGMLMTFFALSTAAAFVIRRPWYEKLVVFLSAVPIGVLANVARITLTGVLFRTAGGEVARAVFHDLAGWLMMPLALAVLWLELRFLARLFVAVPRPGPAPLPRVPVPPAPTARPAEPVPLSSPSCP